MDAGILVAIILALPGAILNTLLLRDHWKHWQKNNRQSSQGF